jgi:hypothetical protein
MVGPYSNKEWQACRSKRNRDRVEVDWQHIRPSEKEVEHLYATIEVSCDARRVR